MGEILEKYYELQKRKRMKRRIRNIILGVIGVYCILNVGVRLHNLELGACVSLAFDKWDMMHVDKAILYVDDTEYIFTDIDFVRQIAKETAVAQYGWVCNEHEDNKTRRIELYRGEKLVRNMEYYSAHGYVRVYTSDWGHWLWFTDSEEGFAELSNEVFWKIEEITKEN